ncbi:ion transporter [Actinophytocola sediminis]
MSVRERARELVERPAFRRAVITVILLNAVTLGLETGLSAQARSTHIGTASIGDVLHTLDQVALAAFVAELLVRGYAYGWRFFTDPWNVFDTLVVGVALVPSGGPLSVLRTLRVLRVLRLISAVPSMRRVLTGLLTAAPGLASVAALLAMVIFVAAVMATNLFAAIAPESFGDLGRSLFTLFQTMTGEGWPDVAREVMASMPLAWIFFVIYILVSSFAVLNLFIAVMVRGMEDQVTDDLAAREEANAANQAASDQRILAEVRALRAELAELRNAEPSPRKTSG